MSKTAPNVSVYGTVYNSAFAIGDCLKSLVSQFDFNGDYEFIAVDNYSTDGTFEVLQKYAEKYRNFRVIQQKCTKGVGRTVAYQNTRGKYTFYVDLDTVYLPGFSKLIKRFVTGYNKNSMFPFGFMDRMTADRAIPWKDMNTYEDLEFEARLISDGVSAYYIPVTLAKNYIVTGNRDMRYEKKNIKLIRRLYRNLIYGIKGRGIKDFRELRKRYTGIRFAFAALVLLKMKIFREGTYAYSDLSSNTEYVKRNEIILDPNEFGVEKRYWLSFVQPRFLELDTANAIIEKHLKLGFNRMSFLKNGLILIYTDATDKKLLDYSLKFLQNY
jgi:glycosyltransferase involved in cell wall biosynthesis